MMRERVSLLELAEDFGFAEHHRVEAARDLEQMKQTVRFGEGIEFITVKLNSLSSLRRGRKKFRHTSLLAPPRKKCFQFCERFDGFQRRRGVDFHAIARRENHGLARDTGFAQRLERVGNFRLGKSKPLPQFHGRRMMAQTDDNNVHG